MESDDVIVIGRTVNGKFVNWVVPVKETNSDRWTASEVLIYSSMVIVVCVAVAALVLFIWTRWLPVWNYIFYGRWV